MPRESPDYRNTLEDVLKFSQDRRILSFAEVCTYTGKGRDWIASHLGLKSGSISAMTLARRLCEL